MKYVVPRCTGFLLGSECARKSSSLFHIMFYFPHPETRPKVF